MTKLTTLIVVVATTIQFAHAISCPQVLPGSDEAVAKATADVLEDQGDVPAASQKIVTITADVENGPPLPRNPRYALPNAQVQPTNGLYNDNNNMRGPRQPATPGGTGNGYRYNSGGDTTTSTSKPSGKNHQFVFHLYK